MVPISVLPIVAAPEERHQAQPISAFVPRESKQGVLKKA
jgi:hypothetical protein